MERGTAVISASPTASFDEEAARLLESYQAAARGIYAEEHLPFPWEN